MRSPRCLLRIIGAMGMLLYPISSLCALTVDHGDGTTHEGVYSSAVIVEGHPAIAYTNDQDTAVKFVRATDSIGAAWGPPVIVDSAAPVGRKVSLRVIDGNPAVCYTDVATGNLKYARAATPTGSVWNAPVTVDIGGVPGSDVSRHDCTLEVAGGIPSICLSGTSKRQLLFIRAADALGSAWGTPVEIESRNEVYESCMKIVQDRPAIVYGNGLELWYIRATDATGTAWSERISVGTYAGTFYARQRPSLEIVNGHPALCHFNDENRAVYYQRATDAAGTSWETPFAVSSASPAGSSFSMALVNGRPAIGHPPAGGILGYVRATDGDGAAAWGTPVKVDTLGAGDVSTLLEVNGNPALVYHDGQGLKYLRATDASGGLLWPPQILVSANGAGNIARGGDLILAPTPVGGSSPLKIFVFNHSGSVPLSGVAATIDGPDAAEFRLVAAPNEMLPGNSWHNIDLEYAPVKPGVKTAWLRFIYHAEGVRDSYDLRLHGSSLPDISVERTTDISLPDGGDVRLPFPARGAAADFALTIRNTGTAELNSLAISFDGPDAGEFSVFAAPASFVPVGGRTSFTIRHTTSTAGRKSAVMHIASNAAGDKNPFDITLRTVPGGLDSSFVPNIGILSTLTGLALGADETIFTGGLNSFTAYQPSGAFNTAFFSPPIEGGWVETIALQPDGKILIGGLFNRAGGQSRPGIARLEADGSLDESFVPSLTSRANDIILQPDGKILVGGPFTPFLARLHPDGSLDAAFSPPPLSTVLCLALQPDGKILAGLQSDFVSQPRPLVRLHADGTLDDSVALSGDVFSLAVMPNGNVIAGGSFPGRLMRLLPDLTQDASMTLTANDTVYDLALQADGACLVAGAFSSIGGSPRRRVARIDPAGSLDDSFNPEAVGSSVVRHLAVQENGKVILAGDFPIVGALHRHLARLNNDSASSLLKAQNSTTVRWLRGGTAPELSQVTFEWKPPGDSDWTLPARAARIPGGWELSGLTLPTGGTLRARGHARGSLFESIAPVLTSIEYWRLEHFGIHENTGPATDDADPDHDELTNFTEFAFGLSPIDGGGNRLPEFIHDGSSFHATFTAPAGREDILYSAEWSASLLPGTWTAIPDTGAGGTHRFSAPAEGSRIFVRFVIKGE